MKLKQNILIGISGTKGSGKDLIATMIAYIFRNGISGSDFRTYTIRNEENSKNNYNIIHFADSLKYYLSKMLNIPLDYFNNRIYKDKLIFLIKDYLEGKATIKTAFIGKDEANTFNIDIITNKDLELANLSDILKGYKSFGITLRTLMQYFGTDIIRNNFYDKLWIFNTINNAKAILENNPYCIISDVRFVNEANSIKYIKNCKNIKGFLIKVERESKLIDSHSSENIHNINADYIIDNNSTKMSLFYKVLNIVKDIIDNTK